MPAAGSARSERSKAALELQQEKFHALLNRLVQEEDNKYCADCMAKGPRWASHNLGVFLCIRCAGIHRNLGVHLSKVKSINLDSWSIEQVEKMLCIGNLKARKIYESRLADSYVRPGSDSPLEQFIRAKYEHKKYCHTNWQELSHEKPEHVQKLLEDLRVDTSIARRKVNSSEGGSILAPPPSGSVFNKKSNEAFSLAPPSKTMGKVKPESSKINKTSSGVNAVDLLGFDSAVSSTPTEAKNPPSKSNTSTLDLFNDFATASDAPKTEPSQTKPPASTDLFADFASLSITNNTSDTNTSSSKSSSTPNAPLSNESILSLFGNASSVVSNQPHVEQFNSNSNQFHVQQGLFASNGGGNAMGQNMFNSFPNSATAQGVSGLYAQKSPNNAASGNNAAQFPF